MPKWTSEQKEAIQKSGSNIIVSAGAGSGKTAVLSERVLEKVKNKIHINELLILTFTKSASAEMKDRIRKKLIEEGFNDEANLISSSYITTFDSFALSIVKKYHYLLNISSNISITDESIIRIEEKKIMDELFEKYYESKNVDFENLIKNYCVKNDDKLRELMLEIANKINSYIDKDEYINFIENEFYSEENIERILKEYEEFISEKKRVINLELLNMESYFDYNYMQKVHECLDNILSSNTYELNMFGSVKLPNVPSGTLEEGKKIKNNVSNLTKELLSYAYGNKDELKYSILNTKNIVFAILDIVKNYIKELNKFKSENNIYTFNDIAYNATKILKEHEDVRNELKYSFKEIMIDEYQDTNNIQDEFISYIENNNVYMVGDIKQSIYRFRGSNPDIFKDKYDKYSKNINGCKIDLIKNFRSRKEVLNNINKIFELIMDDELGGANYKLNHEMVYGNTSYDKESDNDFKYDIDIFEYENERGSKYTDSEIEIFAIAKDIKDKMNSKLKIFDKNENKLRPISYSDFVIILDRSKYFNEYKRIFEYLSIPLTILRDDKLNASSDILIIKNIIDFIIRINNKDFGVNFKYDFMSIGRSFLYEYSDNDLFNYFKNNDFNKSKLFNDFNNININSMTCNELLDKILDITQYYSKISKIGDYENVNVKIKTIYNLSMDLNNLGYSIEEFRDYLNEIVLSGIDINYSTYNSNSDSVKIMTIHASKGLEYPICYFADLNHKFNDNELKKKFIVDRKYGLIVPNEIAEDDKAEKNILKDLYKNNYIKEEISEKLRLFYVALTRAREKMVIVIPKKEVPKLEMDACGVIDKIRRLKFNKLSDFITMEKPYLSEYFTELDINSLNLTKNYLYQKNISDNDISLLDSDFEVEEVNIEKEIVEEEHFSKESLELINKEEKDNMEFGTMVHEVLELIDFKNYDESVIENKFVREKVNKFMNSKLINDIENTNIYHEYEFMYESNSTIYHGIIDLMIEHSDYIDLVDFKLKNINDEKYIKQLNGYKDYINSISNKKVNLYLYSIINGTIEEL